MKKEALRATVMAVAVFIAYNFAVFMIPCLKTPTFWISWGYTLLSFVIAGFAIYASLFKHPDTKSRFYGFPIAKIGFFYLVAQIAFGGICMALGHITPWWVPTVFSAIMLALATIGLVSAEVVVDEIRTQDGQLKKNVQMMRSLQSKVSRLAAQSENTAIKALAEEFRYSDPVSNDSLVLAEAELAAVVEELQTACIEGNDDVVAKLCRKASTLLAERNRLCKLNK